MRRASAFVMSLVLGLGAHAAAITVARDGKSDMMIVVAEDKAAPAEQTAARELQAHLKLVTGAELPIYSEGAAPEAMSGQIVVGQTADFRAAFPDFDLATLKHDGILMRTRENKLYLLGGRPRGTLYAVYSFLEDVVGVRWWGSRPDEVFIPQTPTLEVPALDLTYVPKLQYREAFYRGALEGVYAARSRCNGHFARCTPEYGGHYRLLGWCHTFDQLLPPAKYFQAHPEWYSEINGKRVAERAQLCLTNEAMRQQLTQVALQWLRKDPTAGIISLAQNDCHGPCQCANCARVVAEEGAESGNLIRFVNAVAADIEKEFPQTLVETLAYTYTRTPPKLVKPRHNVIVRLCTIECSYAQPLGTGPQNEKFKHDIEGWSAVAPQLYIWDYVTDFANYMIPHPNLRVLAPNIRFFVENKAIGLFEQGDTGCSCSDFPELRAWLLAHLMWDPTRDDRALIAEFLRGYYGAAATPLQQYLDLIHDAVEHAGAYLSCYMNDTSTWMDMATASRAAELFKEAAERVKADPLLSTRVRRARLPLDHTFLQRYVGFKRLAAMTGTPFTGPDDPRAAVEEFIATAHRFDVGNYREGRGFQTYEPDLRAKFPAPGKEPTPPAEVAGLTADAWTDVQQGEFTLHGLGSWVTAVDDPAASDGRAARMPGSHNQWATQYPVPGDLTALGKWRCYLVARCEAKAKRGPAFQIGLYDARARKGVTTMDVKLEQAADGAYHTYDLGVRDLTGGMYFWVAPMGNPEQVTAIFTDRIFLVRQTGG